MNRHHRSLTHERLRNCPRHRGATLIEYTLMISLILLVALAGVSAFGGTLSGNVDDSASRVVTAGHGP